MCVFGWATSQSGLGRTWGGLGAGATVSQCGVNCGTHGDTLLSSCSFTDASVSSMSFLLLESGSDGSATAALGRSSFCRTIASTPS
jgi:hypothetical protein